MNARTIFEFINSHYAGVTEGAQPLDMEQAQKTATVKRVPVACV